MNINYATLMRWNNEYSDISGAFKKGMDFSNERVENELFRNATGYEFEEEVAIKIRHSGYRNGNRWEREEVVIQKLKKWKPAETVAQIFWLKNRRPEDWRDKQIIEQSVLTVPVEIVNDSGNK